ncbi:Polysaccharide pyruvyl transferase [Zunongwangia mangrovi]|uniref:Polysaccharide pyruvyl transferase n=1 Tax=Zunongwangia mangrovi TaxID=1334022 RepID=A0A1I1D4P6_9FLAO|nr:polysaccharide pyruvyl transferase family protein [Zunongwangia mangrovi]SFB69767.1 Polysaccharide pyruvyl transferase [Zunongwangia mangrovi]
MKKIGIITISRTNNYGAELQAYALQRKLRDLGYDAELIDYLYYKHKDHKPTGLSQPLIKQDTKSKFKNFLMYRVISPLIEGSSVFSAAIENRKKNFYRFHANGKTRYSKDQYRSYEELYKMSFEYDIYMVGSDQVWNPGTGTSLSPYFLDFAPKNKLKVTYASSFGVSQIPESLHAKYRDFFNNLDFIGVREKQGVALVEQLSGKQAKQVLDPTLLLSKDDWSRVINEDNKNSLPKGDYILVYKLHESDELVQKAYELKRKFNCEIYNLCKRAYANKKIEGIYNIEDGGPSEFIALFQNAKFVLTTSFHGTAFSVNFNIPFFAVLRPNKANNSRITNFLEMLHLSDRIVWEGGENDNWELSENINFSEPNRLLNEFRNDSMEYLQRILNAE